MCWAKIKESCAIDMDGNVTWDVAELLDAETMGLLKEAEEDIKHGRTIDGDELRGRGGKSHGV